MCAAFSCTSGCKLLVMTVSSIALAISHEQKKNGSVSDTKEGREASPAPAKQSIRRGP